MLTQISPSFLWCHLFNSRRRGSSAHLHPADSARSSTSERFVGDIHAAAASMQHLPITSFCSGSAPACIPASKRRDSRNIEVDDDGADGLLLLAMVYPRRMLQRSAGVEARSEVRTSTQWVRPGEDFGIGKHLEISV